MNRHTQRLTCEALEDRTTPSYGLGYALGVGGAGTDAGVAVAADPGGNTAVAGNFQSGSIDVDPGPGTYALTNAGGADALVVRYDSGGRLLWAVHLASVGNNYARDVAVDGAGNVLVAGDFAGSIEIGAPGATPVVLTNGGGREGFLAKLGPAGDVLWARGLGGDGRSVAGVAADAAGNVYAAGRFGGLKLFAARYAADGSPVWAREVTGGTGKTYPSGVVSFAHGEGVAVDAYGNVYVTGTYAGKIDFNPAPKKANTLTSAGSDPSEDAFVLKLNTNGVYVWAGSMGGRGYDGGQEVALDGWGNVHVNGYFAADPENDFDPGAGKLTLAGSGGFVVKLDPSRNLLWGAGGVGTGGLAVDAAGSVYTTGSFAGTFDADPGAGVYNLTTTGDRAVFVTKLDSTGRFAWAGAFGGPGYHQGNGIAVDGEGNVYVTGSFRGAADFDPGDGQYPLDSTAGLAGDPSSDLFAVKLTPGV